MKLTRQRAFIPSTLLCGAILLLVSCCARQEAETISCPVLPDTPTTTSTLASSTVTATNTTPESAMPSTNQAPVVKLAHSDLDVKTITRTVAYSLPVFHLNQLPLDEQVSTNAFNLFIDSLDPAHSYFLQSDIDAFMVDAKTLHQRLRKGDISFAIYVYNLLKERIADRMAFTEKQLETGFDTSIEEDFLWDRQDAPWPKDRKAWDDLWRKRLKNEYITRLVAKQVYADEGKTETTNAVAMTETNLLAETETVSSNSVANADDVLSAEPLTPEEFILERYKQFKLTMDSFDEEMLLQRYLTSFALVYDPHSDYMSPSSVEDFDINMKLSLVGIGAMLRPEDGAARIVRVIPGGPADKDGRLKAGDKIIAVGQGDEEPVSILHWPLYKSVRLIRGEKDTTVVLTVIPASDRSGTRSKTIDLMREEVKLEEQAAKGEIKKVSADDKELKLGVITLPDFYADFKATSRRNKNARRASTDVRRLVNELQVEGMEGLVLDLRNNGGGSLMEAIDIAGLFISSGPVVQVKEREGEQVLSDDDPETYYEGPMIVLVNRLSASASEILAAAMQDYKRAIIVGDRRTHGKGTVQTLIPLGKHKGSLKITQAGFYRINGGSTQLKGVTPDIIIPSYLDVMDIGEDSLEHALPWDTIRPALYRMRDGYTEYLPILSAQSKERLEDNDEFKTYLSRRERLKSRYETKTISLSLENRLAEAEAEKELDDIQNGSFLNDDEEEDQDHDIILDETLHILSDMISLSSAEQSVKPVLSARKEILAE